ncbi:MAG TPA: septal ring lytic transglycosylase RlpA family protein [Bacteroidia bacterium]|nr:septal ring lytic transglycosylase RlpA family protein [Bacteroidia bacterium]
MTCTQTLLILLASFVSVVNGSQLNADNDTLPVSGKASFYHDKFHGRLTSNGEEYDKNDFTAAHRTLPFNTIVNVKNKKNGKSVIVRINDRGPFVKSRIIDLSRSAAEKIGMVPFGIVPVTLSVMTLLDNVPLNDSSFTNGEFWDCYANKVELVMPAVLVWITDSWKHAFYTASKLAIDNKIENVGIRVSGSLENRTYDVVISCVENDSRADSIAKVMVSQGFRRAHLLNSK